VCGLLPADGGLGSASEVPSSRSVALTPPPAASATSGVDTQSSQTYACSVRWLRYVSGGGFDPLLLVGSLVLVPLLGVVRLLSERPRKDRDRPGNNTNQEMEKYMSKNWDTASARTYRQYVLETIWAGGAGIVALPLTS